ncbi:hypothetical protein [Emticicia sp. 21SJ11W-3]|uniref:hypothetical protein n=1 Tax=Emticicia sp. 21SJ11W-3 TaxID=2916755 RepID=UPI00209E5D53|nr:hypothetical protein [Emticicia sp. 21SJ11W-3]UTA66573.1 hypothetical protein MB380_13280 [Emticicia sp. 21SJ11W-3]
MTIRLLVNKTHSNNLPNYSFEATINKKKLEVIQKFLSTQGSLASVLQAPARQKSPRPDYGLSFGGQGRRLKFKRTHAPCANKTQWLNRLSEFSCLQLHASQMLISSLPY